jgi:hypothetical protein
MERHLAILKNNIVENILVVDPNDQATIDFFGGVLVPDGVTVAIDDVFDGVSFSSPTIPPPTLLEQLAQLDAENTLSQRNLRDFIMLTVEALKRGSPIDLSKVLGISNVIAVEVEAQALRKLL